VGSGIQTEARISLDASSDNLKTCGVIPVFLAVEPSAAHSIIPTTLLAMNLWVDVDVMFAFVVEDSGLGLGLGFEI